LNELHARYIVAIADEGSVSRAANRLLISQPSLSQLLLNIEKELGLKLFTRAPGSMKPTLAGERYLEAAREILMINRRLKQQLDEISSARYGRVLLGSTPNRSQYLFPSVLSAFGRQFPNIEIEIIEAFNSDYLYDMLKAMKLDMAVQSYSKRDSSLEYTKLFNEELVLVVPKDHWLVRQKGENTGRDRVVSIREVAEEPFIYLSHKNGIRKRTDRLFQSAGISPPKAFETGRSCIAHDLVVKDCSGITILADSFLRFILHEKTAAYFRLAERSLAIQNIGICYHKAALAQSMQYLLDLVQEKAILLDKNIPGVP
jgi:DNA-binding transcriptional LysR family regulator